MANEKAIYKKLDVNMFNPADVIKDLAGNIFLKRSAVAQLFQCSLVVLTTTYKRKGLRPMDRYIDGFKPYLLEDVERFYNLRENY